MLTERIYIHVDCCLTVKSDRDDAQIWGKWMILRCIYKMLYVATLRSFIHLRIIYTVEIVGIMMIIVYLVGVPIKISITSYMYCENTQSKSSLRV